MRILRLSAVVAILLAVAGCNGAPDGKTAGDGAPPRADAQLKPPEKEPRDAPIGGQAGYPPDWIDKICPRVSPQNKFHPPADALSVDPRNITQEVAVGASRFRLPEGWSYKDGYIYADDPGVPVGEYRTATYDAGKPGYPLFVPEHAEIQTCETFGSYAPDVAVRHYELTVPETMFGVATFQDHHQYLSYGPVVDRIDDLVLYGSVATDTANEIARSFTRDERVWTATIRLEAEPKLETNRALVAPDERIYNIRFAEPMDRAQTERAIREDGLYYGPYAAEQPKRPGTFLPVTYAFEWKNDRELRVSVGLPDGATEGMYRINVRGALTRDGDVIRRETAFTAVVAEPGQIWRVAADGSGREQLSDFSVPYDPVLLRDGRTILLRRGTYYCECDAPISFLYGLYDLGSGRRQDVPYSLSELYRGPGDFLADPRGFFYPMPHDADAPPLSKEERHIQIDGYVQTAAFSRDGRRVLLLVGDDDKQVKGLDVWLYDMGSGKLKPIARAIRGSLPANQVGSGYFPAGVTDDGSAFYFSLYDEENSALVGERYTVEWSAGTLGSWETPRGARYDDIFAGTSDGAYRYYYSGGLYDGEGKLIDANVPFGAWLGASHRLAYVVRVGEAGKRADRILAMDADSGGIRIVSDGWPTGTQILGGSADGKWIMVSAPRK